jgi:hypothetical protein
VNLQKRIVSTVIKKYSQDPLSAACFCCIICHPILSLAVVVTLLSHRPLPRRLISSHRLPPAVRTTTLLPLSSLQPPPYPDRSRCAVRSSSRTLVMLSAHPRHSHCNPLLATTALVAPSAARSRHPTASTTTSPLQ